MKNWSESARFIMAAMAALLAGLVGSGVATLVVHSVLSFPGLMAIVAILLGISGLTGCVLLAWVAGKGGGGM